MIELYSKNRSGIDYDTAKRFFKYFQAFVAVIPPDPLAIEVIVEMIPFGLYFKDSEGQYRVINQVFEQITGKTHADIIGNTDEQVLFAGLKSPVQGLYQRMIGSDESLADRIKMAGPDEEPVDYFAGVAPVKDALGRNIGSAGFLIQLSDTIKDQEYYDEIDQQYHMILENTNDAICIVEDGMIRFHNAKLEELLGYSRNELRTLSFLKFVHADDRKTVEERYRIRMQGDKIHSQRTFRFIHKDGGIVWASTATIKIKRSQRDALLCISRDVTSQKNLEIQLNHARKMEAIGTLAGGIAHDFNNILGALISYTEASLYILPDDLNELRSNLSHILMAGQRAKELIKRILNFSRPAEKEKQIVSVKSLIDETLRLLRASLPSTIEIQKKLPDNDICIQAYEEQIQQVLMNLGSNAAHAMGKKGGVFQISVHSTNLQEVKSFQEQGLPPGEYVVISVSDTGSGIDPKDFERIFDPYFTTKKNEDGTGLGLAISKEIIKNHNGAIAVQNKPGEGCIFNIYFPQVGSEMRKRSMEEMKSEVLKGTERILLVDDEELLIIALSRLLISLGYQLTVETDSTNAFKRFENSPDAFDIVITDQTMPGMTGSEFAGKILALRPEMPIILCTGYSDNTSKEEALAIGISDFIMKPCKIRELCQSIRRLLDKA